MFWQRFFPFGQAQRATPNSSHIDADENLRTGYSTTAAANGTLQEGAAVVSSSPGVSVHDSGKENPASDHSLETKQEDSPNNIVNLQTRVRAAPHEYRNYDTTRERDKMPEGLHFTGLMDDPVIKDFFAQNFWGFGHYDGSHYKSAQSMELGKNTIVARFQNTLCAYLSRKRAHLTKLRATTIETKGICSMTTAQLELACGHVEADIQTLLEQFEFSKTRQGWVYDALNRYEIGFAKGLRDTIPFDRLL